MKQLFKTTRTHKLLCAALCMCASSAVFAAEGDNWTAVESTYYNLVVPNKAKSAVEIVSKNGVRMFNLGAIKIGNKPKVNTWDCSYETAKNSEGTDQLIINFKPAAASGKLPSGFSVKGTLTCNKTYIDVLYEVDGCQGYAEDWSGTMARFGYLNKVETKILDAQNMGKWVRHDLDGLPFETKFAKIVPFVIDGLNVCLAYGDDNNVNLGWKDDNYRHVMPVKQADGSYLGHFMVLIAPEATSYDNMVSQWQNNDFFLKLESDHVYNWWKDNSGNMGVTAQVSNATEETKEAVVKYWVTDWSGNRVLDSSAKITLAGNEKKAVPVFFKPTAKRDIYVLEVSVEDVDGNEVTFARTNLALLPDHNFSATPDSSIMGLSAYWELPDADNLYALLKRMGVKWTRTGDKSKLGGAQPMYHTNSKTDITKTYTDAERDKIIEDCFAEMVANGSNIWEFCNEVNLKGDGVGKATYVSQYVDWLKAIRKVQQQNEAWKDIKIISFGISGADIAFLDQMKALGGWDLLDGIALHPGRGNYVPDYPVKEPWNNYTKSDADSYWNYYGTIRQVKDYIRANGNNKSLYLTEVYACDAPNRSWYDTPSEAADNVVLSYALAKAEGVANCLFYQLFNSVHYDLQGIDANDPEYFYGLANRDLSFKPSLMAFCNVAEVFDRGVTFSGWVQHEDQPTLRHMSFTSKEGNVDIIWDRTGGYTELRPYGNCFPEYWASFWEEEETPHVNVSLPVSESTVTVFNSIGQGETRAAVNGKVDLEVSAHPQIIVRGGESAVSEIAAQDIRPVAYYGIDGCRLSGMTRGINIVKMSDGTSKKVMVK